MKDNTDQNKRDELTQAKLIKSSRKVYTWE